jgi:hypothetical protein
MSWLSCLGVNVLIWRARITSHCGRLTVKCSTGGLRLAAALLAFRTHFDVHESRMLENGRAWTQVSVEKDGREIRKDAEGV